LIANFSNLTPFHGVLAGEPGGFGSIDKRN
jgi:hypothetical protein